MKRENILLPISIIILGGCLILSAWVASNELKGQQLEKSLNTLAQTKALMTSNEAAQYMGISIVDFDFLINSQAELKSGMSTYDKYMFISFIDIGNQKYFNKVEIDKWIEYNIH
ncbi:helix-turn-helix domain-containing protein [Paenibacillus sacheonensis]|uniref:Uncharacterized protein n=1 Tax=Paenibacillus sacheonensis TaxID=742054 RepID=A0A7X4YQ60_9BACL|nr:helix-turn-helix domain-containing protein [Paenibacillus sacheonensis]MBM7566241.1 hypothetical protein [Paenibacillus sacheonensis]NBC70448.1 hypothetical protein [Paenibacillus sacheonensis]